MSKSVLPRLIVALLLFGGIVRIVPLPSCANAEGDKMSTAQGDEIVLNGTDYNATWTVHYTPELGNATEDVTARIIVEYGDFVSTGDISSGVPRYPISPRILVEYADYASNKFPLQSPTITPDPVIRIMVEYADYASTLFSLRYACDINDDHKVDMRDVAIAARLYGSNKGSVGWNMIADINGDTKIDMKDIGAIARHYGERYP